MSVINKKQIAEQIVEKQQSRERNDFSKCSEYTSQAMNDVQLKLMYELFCSPGRTPAGTAYNDMKYAPVITDLDVSGYKGQLNDIIFIEAIDDFQVDRVKISIISSEDKLIENGEAALIRENGIWMYIAKTINENLTGTRIKVSAFDIPGNKTSLKKLL